LVANYLRDVTRFSEEKIKICLEIVSLFERSLIKSRILWSEIQDEIECLLRKDRFKS
jgi:hypothetical protein